MKTIRVAALALLVCAFSHVQAQYALQTGKMQFNGGIGLSEIGWLIAGIDYGFEKNISIGGELSVGTSARGLGSYSSVFGLNANANYHFVELLELEDIYDVYAGLNLGIYSDIALIGLGAQIGGRYYFKKNMAVNVELGGGNVFRGGKVGLSILLN